MTNRKSDTPTETGESQLGRRSYLKAAAGATALLATGTATVSANENYDVVEVPAGETHSIRLGDGDVLENVLIDITNAGAGYDIKASGDDWIIRNVGIRGSWDYDPGSSVFRVRVESTDATGLIENVYLGDGDEGSTWSTTGIYVYWDHAGDLEVRNVNIQNFSDNGLYGSAPGNTSSHPAPGSGGTVRVHDSYAAGNETSGFRLGTTGSYCDNCVMWDNQGQRGFWGYYETTELRNCDIGGHSGDIAVGAGAWDSAATVEVTDTRYETETFHYGGANVVGSSAGDPTNRIPAGVPKTADEAAAGESTSGDGDTNSGDEAGKSIEDVWVTDGRNHVVFSGGDGVVEYSLSGRGVAEYGDDANTRDDDPYRETITTDGDAYTVEGYLGGAQDDFYLEGAVETVDADAGIVATVNGVEFDPAELQEVGTWSADSGPRTLEVAGQFDYRVEVSGEIRPAEEHAQWLTEGEAYGDDWAEWWLSGSDAARTVWEFTGEITNLEITDHDGVTEIRTLTVDDEALDHSQYDATHRLEVAGQFDYRVGVSGEIRPAEEHAQWLTEGEAYGDDWAEWWLSGSDAARTVWEFTGEITNLEITDHDGVTEIRTLTVDGSELNLSDYS